MTDYRKERRENNSIMKPTKAPSNRLPELFPKLTPQPLFGGIETKDFCKTLRTEKLKLLRTISFFGLLLQRANQLRRLVSSFGSGHDSSSISIDASFTVRAVPRLLIIPC